jgi:hypothetical protein
VTPDSLLDQTHVEPNTGWLWTGGLAAKGYGYAHHEGRSQRVHRMSYEFFVGPIPDGMQVDHKCHTRACANPSHLRLCSNVENHRNRLKRGGSSRFKGVSWNHNLARPRWQAHISRVEPNDQHRNVR